MDRSHDPRYQEGGRSVYRLRFDMFGRAMILLGLAGFLVAAAFLLIAVFAGHERAPLAFVAVFLVVVIFVAYRVLSMPHRIEVDASGTMTFVSLMGRVEVRPTEVESIRPERAQFGFFILRHRGGRIRFLAQFDGFHELVMNLKQANPGVELEGC